MSYLKIQDEESVLTKFVSAKESRTRNLQSQISLDGTEYLTRYGEPVIRYEVTAYVDERGRKKLADAMFLTCFIKIPLRKIIPIPY